MSLTFTAVLELHGRSATGIEVPAEVVEALGAGKKPAVSVTVDGYGYRTTVAPRGGVYLIPFSSEHRTATGIAAGDTVTVTIEVDTAPRTVEVPVELQAALDGDPVAAAAWAKLSYSHQREHALAVGGAKGADTRARRVAKAIEMLRARS